MNDIQMSNYILFNR